MPLRPVDALIAHLWPRDPNLARAIKNLHEDLRITFEQIGASSVETAGAFPPLDLALSYVKDDFRGGTEWWAADGITQSFEKSGSIGELGWSAYTGAVDQSELDTAHGAVNVFPTLAFSRQNPGVVELAATPAGGKEGRSILALTGGAGSGYGLDFYSELAWSKRFIFAQSLPGSWPAVKGGLYRIGLADSFFGAHSHGMPPANPPRGVYLEANTFVLNDTTWFAVFDNGSTHLRVNTGISLLQSTFIQLGLTHVLSADQVVFTINESTTIGTSFYSSSWPQMSAFMEVQSQDNTGESMYMDFYDSLIFGLQRWAVP